MNSSLCYKHPLLVCFCFCCFLSVQSHRFVPVAPQSASLLIPFMSLGLNVCFAVLILSAARVISSFVFPFFKILFLFSFLCFVTSITCWIINVVNILKQNNKPSPRKTKRRVFISLTRNAVRKRDVFPGSLSLSIHPNRDETCTVYIHIGLQTLYWSMTYMHHKKKEKKNVWFIFYFTYTATAP